MKFREFSGKTLDDAIEMACSYFNVKENFLKHEVMKKRKGSIFASFLGNEVVIKAKPVEVGEENSNKSKKTSKEEQYEELSKFGKEAVEIVENIIKLTGYEYRMSNTENKEELRIGIFGPNMKGLIQEDGVGIEAMKHIAGRIFSKRGNFSKRLHIDVNEFRKEKEIYIQKLAQRLSEKAKNSKREVIVNSMNAYDRRIFHLAVEEIEGVTTRSLGDGQFKKIKVIPS